MFVKIICNWQLFLFYFCHILVLTEKPRKAVRNIHKQLDMFNKKVQYQLFASITYILIAYYLLSTKHCTMGL